MWVASFFSENDLKPEITETETHARWEAGNITIIQGDFFTIPAGSMGDVGDR